MEQFLSDSYIERTGGTSPYGEESMTSLKDAVRGMEVFFESPLSVLVVTQAGTEDLRDYIRALNSIGVKDGSTIFFLEIGSRLTSPTAANGIVNEYGDRLDIRFTTLEEMDSSEERFDLILTHDLMKYIEDDKVLYVVNYCADLLTQEGVLMNCVECFYLAPVRRLRDALLRVAGFSLAESFWRSQKDYDLLFSKSSLRVARYGYGKILRRITFVLQKPEEV
ncbi:MAG: hypothetical protein PHS44_06525 [Candidatus Dojkabacteria bacterium]|nr:hypothetical protein [Candidatus Dojkabacteria bacterium]